MMFAPGPIEMSIIMMMSGLFSGSGLMGLPPGDPRHVGARDIIQDHVDEILAAGEDEDVALQSAFVLACMSPTSAGVGF